MIEVKDEILNGEPLYRIRDENGNIILDNATIEMITPLLQQATPLNKLLFDKITSRLALSSKYNNPTFTIEDYTMKMHIDAPLEKYENGQIVNTYIDPVYEEFSGNIIPTNFTSASQDGFYSAEYKGLNGAGLVYGYNHPTTKDINVYVKCPIAIIPTQFWVRMNLPLDSGSRSATLTVYGSNDGETWDTLTSFEASSSNKGSTAFDVYGNYTGGKAYKYFRLYCYSSTAGSYNNYIYNFNITSGQKSTFDERYDQTLQIGDLSAIPLTGKAEIFYKQSLMYLDGKFLVDNIGGGLRE